MSLARAADDLADWVLKRSPRLGRKIAVLAAVAVAVPLAYNVLRGSEAYVGLLEDDFFYYAIVVDKLAATGRLTFDGITTTNGFHPLWFLVLLVMRLLTGGLNQAFYVVLSVVIAASMVATYELSRAFARAVGASEALAPAVALVFAVGTNIVVSSGMETALDVPLLLALMLALSRPGPITVRRAASLGLLASLAILSRLDVALVVPLAFAGWLTFGRPAWGTVGRATAAFCAAGIAVPLYAAFNLFAFGSVLPVSGLAKQLVLHPGFNLGYGFVVLLGTVYGWPAGATLFAGVVALAVLYRRRLRPAAAIEGWSLFGGALALAFAAVFYTVNAVSGWCYFGWYAYALAPALVAGVTLAGRAAAARIPVALRAGASALAFTLAGLIATGQAAQYFVTRGPRWSLADNGLADLSVELAQVMRGRHGVYAMGAVGGMVAYELGEPLVQLEGLVADRAMVDHVRAEDDLGPVLAAYHVDYLVISTQHAVLEKRDGCYVVTQPEAEWAGKRVAKMRGAICAEPIAQLPTRFKPHAWTTFSKMDTYVFDVRGATWRPAGEGPRQASTPVDPSSAMAATLAVAPHAMMAGAPSMVRARPYGLYVPPGYRPGIVAPLVIALHGLGSRGAELADLFALQSLADGRGVLYAFPDGTLDGRTRFWNATDGCCDFAGTGVDDVGYLRAIVDDVGARYSIDPRRVYVIGLSNGGYMAHRVACDMADRVAAIVSVAGANWKDPERCHPSEPVAVLEVHSDADEVVLYGGKEFTWARKLHVVPSVHETVATWAKRDGCSGPLAPFGVPVDWDRAVPGAETSMERYGACPPGIDVELWTVHGGHHVPDHPAVADLAWAFLEAHPKPLRTPHEDEKTAAARYDAPPSGVVRP
jgi:polyhydroxybutyrate depolymerase